MMKEKLSLDMSFFVNSFKYWKKFLDIHHLANMELGHLLTGSSFTCLKVSLMVSPGFFCLLVCSFLAFKVIYYRAFCGISSSHTRGNKDQVKVMQLFHQEC